MKKATKAMTIALSALLLESAVASAAHQLFQRMSWSRPIIAALVSAASQNVEGSSPEEEFLKAFSQGRAADVSRLLEENPVSVQGDDGKTASDVAVEEKQGAVVELVKNEVK